MASELPARIHWSPSSRNGSKSSFHHSGGKRSGFRGLKAPCSLLR
jgi:hypothetical protein